MCRKKLPDDVKTPPIVRCTSLLLRTRRKRLRAKMGGKRRGS